MRSISSPRDGTSPRQPQQNRQPPHLDVHIRASAHAAGIRHVYDGLPQTSSNVEWLFEEADALESQQRNSWRAVASPAPQTRSEEFTGDDTAALLPILDLTTDSVFAEVRRVAGGTPPTHAT